MKLALIQMEILEKNKAQNVKHGLELLEIASENADIAVLPEIWTTGYSLGKIALEAENIDSDVILQLKEIARKNQCNIIAGSIPLRDEDGKIYNTEIAIDKNGNIISKYSKVHLFGMFNEQDFFAAGNNFKAYNLEGITCGSTICYDLRFPELYRHLSLQGAKIIFVPAEWPALRGDIWRLLLQARAAENHNYIVGVNCVGTFKGAPFYGHSMLVDPMGKILLEGTDKEEILYHGIDLNYIEKVRSRINVLDDVREELIK